VRTKREALGELEGACARILVAPNGAQEETLHRECHYIGRVIGRGDLEFDVAHDALLATAMQMRVYDHARPWREDWLDKHIKRSLGTGEDRALDPPGQGPLVEPDPVLEPRLEPVSPDPAEPEPASTEPEPEPELELAPEAGVRAEPTPADTDEAQSSGPDGAAESAQSAEPPPSAYAGPLESARSIAENDDVALRGLARAAAAAELSEERLDRLARVASKSSKFSLPAVRKAFAQAASQRAAEAQADPFLQAAARAAAAAVRQAEAAQSWSACKGLAFAPDLMDSSVRSSTVVGFSSPLAFAAIAAASATTMILCASAFSSPPP
jgi:hypothetical protein